VCRSPEVVAGRWDFFLKVIAREIKYWEREREREREREDGRWSSVCER
jgi:hypothetical protein